MGTALQEQLIQFQPQFCLLNSAVCCNCEKIFIFQVQVGAEYLPCDIHFTFFFFFLEMGMELGQEQQKSAFCLRTCCKRRCKVLGI